MRDKPIGTFPFQTLRERGKPPINADFGRAWSARSAKSAAPGGDRLANIERLLSDWGRAAVDTAKVGGRELTVDAIAVGTSVQIILDAAAYPRWVTLKALDNSITISTQRSVTTSSGYSLTPGDEMREFVLPEGVRLYGIATAAARLARNVRG